MDEPIFDQLDEFGRDAYDPTHRQPAYDQRRLSQFNDDRYGLAHGMNSFDDGTGYGDENVHPDCTAQFTQRGREPLSRPQMLPPQSEYYPQHSQAQQSHRPSAGGRPDFCKLAFGSL